MSKIKPKECQNVEFKRIWKDEYLKWICGFANAQGGKIVIGVNGAHEVVGVRDSKRLMEDIPNKIVTHLGIVADVHLHIADGIELHQEGAKAKRLVFQGFDSWFMMNVLSLVGG